MELARGAAASVPENWHCTATVLEALTVLASGLGLTSMNSSVVPSATKPIVKKE
jgi:hypothetical protein